MVLIKHMPKYPQTSNGYFCYLIRYPVFPWAPTRQSANQFTILFSFIEISIFYSLFSCIDNNYINKNINMVSVIIEAIHFNLF